MADASIVLNAQQRWDEVLGSCSRLCWSPAFRVERCDGLGLNSFFVLKPHTSCMTTYKVYKAQCKLYIRCLPGTGSDA
jgi:hypothetical protein